MYANVGQHSDAKDSQDEIVDSKYVKLDGHM